jgi:ADP-dependent NAD(P)H-hydrate dehydratase
MSRTTQLHLADVVVDQAVLGEHPLPKHGAATDKTARGIVVIAGGSVETPGAVILAGVAALRAGAGKLRIITVRDAAPIVASAIPEARVIGVPANDGEIDASAASQHADMFDTADAVLVGTGSLRPERAAELTAEAARHVGSDTTLVIDAGALAVFEARVASLGPVAHRTVAMPNPVEAAHVLGTEADDVANDLAGSLDELVSRLGVVVALRHAETWTAGPGTRRFVDRSGHITLATSGSGDVLAGLLTGLAARGADRLTATLWAVHAHGHAGLQAAQRVGGLGVLARELSDELPSVLSALNLE